MGKSSKGAKESNIGSVARYMFESGKPIEVMILVDRSLVDNGKKSKLAGKLRQYGEILDNRPESRLMSLGVASVEDADRLQEAYDSGDLEGITVMEVDRMSVAPHGYGLAYSRHRSRCCP